MFKISSMIITIVFTVCQLFNLWAYLFHMDEMILLEIAVALAVLSGITFVCFLTLSLDGDKEEYSPLL